MIVKSYWICMVLCNNLNELRLHFAKSKKKKRNVGLTFRVRIPNSLVAGCILSKCPDGRKCPLTLKEWWNTFCTSLKCPSVCWLVNVGNSYSFSTTTTSKCSFSFYYRIIIQGDKIHPLIFIVSTNNFIEYLQRYQILIFIYYKFDFIIITQYHREYVVHVGTLAAI